MNNSDLKNENNLENYINEYSNNFSRISEKKKISGISNKSASNKNDDKEDMIVNNNPHDEDKKNSRIYLNNSKN